MKITTKKILIMVVIFIMSLGIFSACGNDKLSFNAIIVSSTLREHCLDIKENFLNENRTLDMMYKNENWDPEDQESEEYLRDGVSPKYRTFIIKNQGQLEDIFSTPPQVDFEKEMILIDMYTVTSNKQYSTKNIKLDGAILKIEIKVEQQKSGNSSEPTRHQSITVMKLDKLDITAAEVLMI